jgi:GNAT superfamily N-acetyltransferase
VTSLDPLRARLATPADLPVLEPLIDAAITELLTPWLDADQIASSRAIMGLDTQLIDDGTYLVVEEDGVMAGCGGWSRRATLYGGDHATGRDPAPLDAGRDPARVRAMYTHPDFARRGVARMILSLCERAAAEAGFRRLELMATMAGLPLYAGYGFRAVETVTDTSTGVPIPLVRMAWSIGRAD